MIIQVVGLIILILVIFTGFFLMLNTIMMGFSWLMGSPFIRTRHNVLESIFNEVNFKKKDKFVDLGCGDGTVVRFVADRYTIDARGVDINFLLILRSNIMKLVQKLPSASFKQQNIFNADISDADIIYLFLLPKLIQKLKPKLIKECKKGVLIISHGFLIDGWEEHKIKTIKAKPFPTHYYKIS